MKTIAIFGTGSALRDFLSILPQDVTVLGLGDNNAALHGHEVLGFRVFAPSDFIHLPFDRCVITSRASDAIRKQLIELGVPAQKISAFTPSYSETLLRAASEDVVTLNSELGLNIPKPGIATVYNWPDANSALPTGVDFVRYQAIKLAAEIIAARKVPGAVAELGVYQGETAALLNRLFHDRDLHLFDTFTGFSNADVALETQRDCSKAAVGDFQDTDLERVMARMADTTRVYPHKGYFPKTAEGVEAQFAFVSLDVDLYAPTLAGLRWFYERLSPGGYIFVHDYNNQRYLGVRQAMKEFLDEVPAVFFALPDFSGSVVLSR